VNVELFRSWFSFFKLSLDFRSVIYTSDLKRAHWTAQQIWTHQASISDPSMPSSAPIEDESGAPTDDEVHSPLETASATAGPGSAATLTGLPTSDSTSALDPSHQPVKPLDPPITTPMLREQYFGEAEGQPWDIGRFSNMSAQQSHRSPVACGLIELFYRPWDSQRQFRFPGGESLEDVAQRALDAVRRIILPSLILAKASGEQKHLVLVAHGIVRPRSLLSP
jgi:bisphosphoglycerate-dependent phosphoglycerate mutase